ISRRGDAVILGAAWGHSKTAPSGPRAIRVACAAIGAALVLLGGSVIAGWILQLRAMVQLLPGITPVSFNSALGFVLAGAWLVVATLRPDLRKTALALAAALSALAAAVLAQDALGVDLGIDAQALQRWLPSIDPHPGRMSVFSAAGFVAA